MMASTVVAPVVNGGSNVPVPRVSVTDSQSPHESDDEELFHDAQSQPSTPYKSSSANCSFAPVSEEATGTNEPTGKVPSSVAVEAEGEDNDESAAPKDLTPEQIKNAEERVRALTEFYFGEENFSKDQFLRKQIALDTTHEGWIKMEVFASFKKMKKITEDRGIMLNGMRAASLVVVNEDGSMVRRKEQLSKDVEDALTRTLVLSNIPAFSTADSITALCSPFGAVARVRFHTEGTDSLPSDIAQYCLDEHGAFKTGARLVAGRQHAFVEYASTKFANVAVRSLHTDGDWRTSVTAVLAHRRTKTGSAVPSPNVSQPPTREASPSISQMIVERARANSLNARVSREASRSPAPSAHASAPDHSHSHAHASPLARFADDGAIPSSEPSVRDRPGSVPLHAASSGGWRSPQTPPAQASSVPTSSRSVSLSPQSARRYLAPPGSAGKSSLSTAGSPGDWRVGSPSVVGSRALPGSGLLRSPMGPDGSRGFGTRRMAPPVA